MKTVIRHTH